MPYRVETGQPDPAMSKKTKSQDSRMSILVPAAMRKSIKTRAEALNRNESSYIRNLVAADLGAAETERAAETPNPI